MELSRIYAVSLAGCLAIPFPSILTASLLIIPLFVLILVHWNLSHLVCKLLDSVSPFCVALPDLGCNSPNRIPPEGWCQAPSAGPPAASHTLVGLLPFIPAHPPEMPLGSAADREFWVTHAQPLLFVLPVTRLTMVIYMAT